MKKEPAPVVKEKLHKESVDDYLRMRCCCDHSSNSSAHVFK